MPLAGALVRKTDGSVKALLRESPKEEGVSWEQDFESTIPSILRKEAGKVQPSWQQHFLSAVGHKTKGEELLAEHDHEDDFDKNLL